MAATKKKARKTKARRKTWHEKLHEAKAKEGLPMTLVVPSPAEVETVMRKVGKGRLITTGGIARILAKTHRTDRACPMTTGLFAWMVAGAAGEDEAAGKKRVVPYWRTLKKGGELNPKYPGGIREQRRRLEGEGHRVVRKGKSHLVVDFEKRMVKDARI